VQLGPRWITRPAQQLEEEVMRKPTMIGLTPENRVRMETMARKRYVSFADVVNEAIEFLFKYEEEDAPKPE
jgi:hypothetical protein